MRFYCCRLFAGRAEMLGRREEDFEDSAYRLTDFAGSSMDRSKFGRGEIFDWSFFLVCVCRSMDGSVRSLNARV